MGAQEEVKFFTSRKRGPAPLVFIVGQNPGRQHEGKETQVVWEGNRSGDFIKELVMTTYHSNVFLTNICNYQQMTPERVREGLKNLEWEIDTQHPKKVICLGLFAYSHVKDLEKRLSYQPRVVIMHHPSFVLRFNKGVDAYAEKLRKELE